MLPSFRIRCCPRMSPVMPATVIIAPDVGDPGTLGSISSVAPQDMFVSLPSIVCPMVRLACPSKARIGKQTSGKSSYNAWLKRNEVLMPFRSACALFSVAPIKQTQCRCAYRIAHSHAAIVNEVLPLPRGIAMANKPPCRMTCSSRLMTRR